MERLNIGHHEFTIILTIPPSQWPLRFVLMTAMNHGDKSPVLGTNQKIHYVSVILAGSFEQTSDWSFQTQSESASSNLIDSSTHHAQGGMNISETSSHNLDPFGIRMMIFNCVWLAVSKLSNTDLCNTHSWLCWSIYQSLHIIAHRYLLN